MRNRFLSLLAVAVVALHAPAGLAAEPTWTADSATGCKVWNANPMPNETVTYTGPCIDGIANGQGVVQWFQNGTRGGRSEGVFRNGRLEGRGTNSWRDGSTYAGDYAGGNRNGFGELRLARGSSGIPSYGSQGTWEGDVYVVRGMFDQNRFVRSCATAQTCADKAAASAPAAWSTDAEFPDRIDIPDAFAIRTKQGCRLINPFPKPNETASWSGACRNGLAEGPGTVTWMINGAVSSTSTGYYERGWELTPYIDDWPNVLVRTLGPGKDCRLIVPIDGLKSLSARFEVRYPGRCPTDASTLIHQDRTAAEARVYFDGKLFATFTGRVAKGAIPVAGEMTFFGGSKFVFTDNVSFAGLLTPDVTRAWRGNINAVRPTAGQKDPALERAFNIQIGFNAEPRPPSEVRGKILSFSVEGFTGSSQTQLRYAVTPAKAAGLKAAAYTISLKTRIDIRETTSMGGFGIGEKRSIYQDVDIRLTKANGYRATGTVKLTELDSYTHALGVTKRIDSAVPTVEITAISVE